MVPEVLNDQYSVEKLSIIGVDGVMMGEKLWTALLNTNKQLTALKFGKYLFPPIQSLSLVFEKFKPSLTSLSLYIGYQFDNYVGYVGMLSSLLSRNSLLNELEIILDHDLSFSHSFLQHAVNLASYSFGCNRITGTNFQHLFTFIATHKSLKSISIKAPRTHWERPGESEASFFLFYEKLVAAIFENPSIDRVGLDIDVEV
jgi:hypothetical protein